MIPAEVLLDGYRQGIFPMAEGNGEIRWYEADPRTILDIHQYHLPRYLGRILKRHPF